MNEQKQQDVVTGHKGIVMGKRTEMRKVKPGEVIALTERQARAFRDRIRPMGSRATSAAGTSPKNLSRAALEAELLAAGYKPTELLGTGQDGNVVKGDLITAVELIRAGQEPELAALDDDEEQDED